MLFFKAKFGLFGLLLMANVGIVVDKIPWFCNTVLLIIDAIGFIYLFIQARINSSGFWENEIEP